MTNVITLTEFEEWFESLSTKDAEKTAEIIGLLEELGVDLPYPYCSSIKDVKYAIRELRFKLGGSPCRVFYAFDPKRQAVLILAGIKTHKNFYKKLLPSVEKLWEQYLEEQKNG